MYRKNFKTLAAAATLCAVAGVAGAAIGSGTSRQSVSNATNAATSLTCEGLERPLGVNTLTPRFSWQLPDNWKAQSAYELQIGTDSTALASGGETDLWATGRIESAQSVNIEYAGDALVPGIQAYWRVKVWNNQGDQSAWSEVSRFGVGYVDGSEMPGEYIGMGGTSSQTPRKYILIPNRVYTGIANHRYNQPKYLDGIDYPVEYVGFSTAEKIHWDSDEIDRVEIHLNVKTPADATVGKAYRLEILSGDEESSYYQYVGNQIIYNNATFNYSINSDNRLFENGTFASDDAGRYTPAGAYKEGDDKIYSPNEIKELGPSVRQVFGGRFAPVTITAGTGHTDAPAADNNVEPEYFDLRGMRVDNPRNGIYVRRTGEQTDKVVIR